MDNLEVCSVTRVRAGSETFVTLTGRTKGAVIRGAAAGLAMGGGSEIVVLGVGASSATETVTGVVAEDKGVVDGGPVVALSSELSDETLVGLATNRPTWRI